ncbi:hypothetical protein [Clostridium ganghwense]|uniref:Uncharacterized protein n=1 Tax=Clostridium ganghwense TaxID=312089 RepID=A0ABT4CMF5_9CLOT|nr:hypothetical protein [Clostridium ganghwense]MCY6369179.1 hypothetical protein [Clostridium ganghwense]
MNIDLNSEDIQPILVVGVDSEKSTFDNITFKVEEFEEGIISYLTIKEIEELLEEVIPYISEEEYNSFVKNNTSLLYLIYDIEEISVFLAASEVIERADNYKKREKKILQRAGVDFSIVG